MSIFTFAPRNKLLLILLLLLLLLVLLLLKKQQGSDFNSLIGCHFITLVLCLTFALYLKSCWVSHKRLCNMYVIVQVHSSISQVILLTCLVLSLILPISQSCFLSSSSDNSLSLSVSTWTFFLLFLSSFSLAAP